MKVISGTLKGRTIKGLSLQGTRPTMDRVKESLFAMIQDYIPNSTCLDLFAGSGNLGIEAISNGAGYVYFSDKNKQAIHTIKDNIKTLNIEEQSIVLTGDYKQVLKQFLNDEVTFDVIFLDPPYDTDYIEHSVKTINEYKLLSPKGIIICESDQLSRFKYPEHFEIIKSKRYGDKHIEIIQYL